VLVTLLPAFAQAASIISKVQPLLLQKVSEEPNARLSIIVQKTLKDDSVEKTVRNLGGIVTKDLSIINAFAAELPASAINQLGQSGDVRWISLDSPTIKSSVCTGCVDTTPLTNTYDVDIRANQVWNKTVNGVQQPWLQGNGIGVAVIDSGVKLLSDFNNTSGASRVVTQQKFNSNTNSQADNYGHGTHVAGIIGGNGQLSNGTYVGIAPAVNLINLKVSDDVGAATASDIVSGLQWVLQNKDTYNIRVVNISMNSSVKQSYNVDPLCAAAEILWFNGIVVVVSAGNTGTADLYPPANDPFVITVGAVDDKGTTKDSKGNFSVADDTVASFSSYGKDETGNVKPDLVAPGKSIVSTMASNGATLVQQHPANQVNNYYFMMSGTSMSAPIVAGAVALLLQSEPNLNPDQVKYRLKATALQSAARGSWDTRAKWTNYNATTAGAGYLDIYAAVTQTSILGTTNTALPASQLLWTGSTPVTWGSANWSSVNWSSVNWSSVNWSSVNWSSVNWSSDYWG
jgi:serine protease AprX